MREKRPFHLTIKKTNFLFFLFVVFYFQASAQWLQYNLPLASAEDLYDISFINNSSFYICSNTQLSKTTDNGVTWNVSTLNNQPYLANTLKALHFYSADEGIITGVFNATNEEYVLSTQDGSASWSTSYYGPPNDLHFFNSLDTYGSNVLVCGYKGHIIKSITSGSSFSDVTTPVTTNLNDIKFISSDWAIAVGEGTLLRTFDGGSSWSKDTAYVNYQLSSISIPLPGTIYLADKYKILKSTDNGTTFTTINVPFNSINCVAALNATTVFIGTGEGIYVSMDGCKTWNKFRNTKTKQVQKIAFNNGKAYALCRNKILLVLDIATMKPEPIAWFTTTLDATCGKTILTCTNLSDVNATNQWYINNVLVSSQYNFSKTYNAPSSFIELKLIIKNANGRDTLITNVGIPYKTPVQADIGQDIVQCYGASMYLKTKYAAPYYDWLPHSAFADSFKQEVLTKPFYNNLKVYLKAYNGDCEAYDTLMIHVGDSIPHTPFFPSNGDGTRQICNINAPSDSVAYALSTFGRLLKTTDGGKNWSVTIMGGNEDFNHESLAFPDEKIGYMPRSIDFVKKTIDGGKTFFDIPIQAQMMSFVNKDTGIFVTWARTSLGCIEIYRTDDGGQTFSLIYNYKTDEQFELYSIKMLNGKVIFLAGRLFFSNIIGPPRIKRSIDGGLTWINIPVPDNAIPNDISVLSKDTLFYNDNTRIHRTYDAGKNWFSYLLRPAVFTDYSDGGFVEMRNSKKGYTSMGKSIFLTLNGGDCWTKIFSDTVTGARTMSISPSGRSIYYSGSTGFVGSTKIYHNNTYRQLDAWIDSSYCEGTRIKTHNNCFGYTHNQWFLNGVLYSTAADTSFLLKEGDYTVKLKVDSLGMINDSLTFKFHIKHALAPLGTISGQTPVCSDKTLSNGMNHADYSITPNSDYTTYFWSVDQPYLLTTPLQGNATTQTLVFASSNTTIKLKVFAKSSSGCLSPDTATFTIRTRNYIPPTPVSLDLHSSSCIRLDSTSFDENRLPKDSLYCTGTLEPLAEFYMMGVFKFPTPAGKIPVYGHCNDQTYKVSLSNATVCGTSQPLEKSYRVFYEPKVFHTPDTIVTANGPADLRIKIISDTSSFGNCNTIYNNWYFKGIYYSGSGNLHFNSVTPADTGVYIVRIFNGCDTTDYPIRLSITIFTGINNSSTEPLYIYPNPFDNILYLSGHIGQINQIQIVDVLGRLQKTIFIKADTTQLNLNELGSGIYFIICTSKTGEILTKQKIIKG